MKKMSYAEAIREAMSIRMREDPNVLLFGEDVGAFGGCFGVSAGMFDEFGEKRVRDTPISEGAIIGAVVGALLFTPIVGLLFMPFLGALLAELIFARKDILAAFKAGSGAALGMLTGLLLEFTCGLLIIAWFCSCYFLF
jgi:pyruvate/2-oxoglutarate/acetoin dehydrogenase E1 component